MRNTAEKVKIILCYWQRLTKLKNEIKIKCKKVLPPQKEREPILVMILKSLSILSENQIPWRITILFCLMTTKIIISPLFLIQHWLKKYNQNNLKRKKKRKSLVSIFQKLKNFSSSSIYQMTILFPSTKKFKKNLPQLRMRKTALMHAMNKKQKKGKRT